MSKEICISIDNTCNGCKRCIDACPSRLFVFNENKRATPINTLQSCIKCGHCVALCPQESIKHSVFNKEQLSTIDYAKYPSAEQLLLLLKARRSNRLFSKKPIEAEKLDLIIEAATTAPTATNLRLVEYTLITDPEMLKFIADYTFDTLIKLSNFASHPLVKFWLKPIAPTIYRYEKMLKRMQKEREVGYELILRHATSLLLIHTSTNNRFAVEDCNLAYQNASLMAETLEINHFYTGFLITILKMKKNNPIVKRLGINGRVCAGMAMGNSAYRYPRYIQRNKGIIQKF